jgi:hypothetical protein
MKWRNAACYLHILFRSGTSTLKMEVAGSSKILVSIYKTTCCHNSEHHSHNFQHCEDLRSHLTGLLLNCLWNSSNE